MNRAKEILLKNDPESLILGNCGYARWVMKSMKQYAEEMVKHNLKIAAENVEFDDDWIFDGEDEKYTIFGVNKKSITNIKIELL